MNRFLTKIAMIFCAAYFSASVQKAFAQSSNSPVVAVTELSYEKSVESHFKFAKIDAHAQSDGSFYGRSEADAHLLAGEGDLTHITRGEFGRFSGDIKGGLIKSGQFRVIEGRPWTKRETTDIPSACFPPKCDGMTANSYSETVTLFDVIDRIKKGYYQGADYVLFGSVTNFESRMESLPVQGSNATNHILSIELSADFSLVNTKTYQVVAAFSAIGEGNDNRLINSSAAQIRPNRSRIVRDVSRSLGDDVVVQIQEQFAQSFAATPRHGQARGVAPAEAGKVTEYR